jgi:hypothetical protein
MAIGAQLTRRQAACQVLDAAFRSGCTISPALTISRLEPFQRILRKETALAGILAKYRPLRMRISLPRGQNWAMSQSGCTTGLYRICTALLAKTPGFLDTARKRTIVLANWPKSSKLSEMPCFLVLFGSDNEVSIDASGP